MGRLLRLFVLVLWLVASSMALALFWVRNADAWNPIPHWVWDQVEKRVNIGCCEQAADVEYLVVLGASILTMLVVTAVIWLLRKWVRRG